jgi:Kef-type K+ transport system membrane component KefB
MWRVALCGVTMIMLVTIAVFILMGLLLGTTIKEAVFVGACVSLSSTAVVVKVIPIEQLGEHLYGLLVMQDVLLGFMLALVPAMAKSGLNVMAKAVLHVSLSFLVFAAMCVGLMRVVLPSAPRLVRRLVPPSMLATVVQNLSQYHHELVLLGALAICLVMSVVSESLGLGMELGCFAAGVVIRSISTEPSSSQHHHHQHNQHHQHHHHDTASSLLLTVITPVRDLFSCLFFASIGLHVYPSFLASELMLLLILTTMVMGFKYLVTTGVLVSMNTFDLRACSSMSVALAQISEFAFVLASRAKQLHIISREVYYLLLAVTALTLMATPVLWKLTHTNHQHGDDTGSDADKVA